MCTVQPLDFLAFPYMCMQDCACAKEGRGTTAPPAPFTTHPATPEDIQSLFYATTNAVAQSFSRLIPIHPEDVRTMATLQKRLRSPSGTSASPKALPATSQRVLDGIHESMRLDDTVKAEAMREAASRAYVNFNAKRSNMHALLFILAWNQHNDRCCHIDAEGRFIIEDAAEGCTVFGRAMQHWHAGQRCRETSKPPLAPLTLRTTLRHAWYCLKFKHVSKFFYLIATPRESAFMSALRSEGVEELGDRLPPQQILHKNFLRTITCGDFQGINMTPMYLLAASMFLNLMLQPEGAHARTNGVHAIFRAMTHIQAFDQSWGGIIGSSKDLDAKKVVFGAVLHVVAHTAMEIYMQMLFELARAMGEEWCCDLMEALVQLVYTPLLNGQTSLCPQAYAKLERMFFNVQHMPNVAEIFHFVAPVVLLEEERRASEQQLLGQLDTDTKKNTLQPRPHKKVMRRRGKRRGGEDQPQAKERAAAQTIDALSFRVRKVMNMLQCNRQLAAACMKPLTEAEDALVEQAHPAWPAMKRAVLAAQELAEVATLVEQFRRDASVDDETVRGLPSRFQRITEVLQLLGDGNVALAPPPLDGDDGDAWMYSEAQHFINDTVHKHSRAIAALQGEATEPIWSLLNPLVFHKSSPPAKRDLYSSKNDLKWPLLEMGFALDTDVLVGSKP